MPTKITKAQKSIEAAAALPLVPRELTDQSCTGPMAREALNAAEIAFKRVLIERVVGGELSHHLDYARGNDKHEQAGNHRRRRQRQDFDRQRRPAAHRRATRLQRQL